MKPDHCQIQSRKQCCCQQCQISQYSKKCCHFKMMIPVFTALHKTAECTRQDQGRRRIITQKCDFSIEKFQCRPIRAFRHLILRKRRIPGFLSQLFQHSTVQNSIYFVFFQPVFDLFQKFFMYQIFDIQYLNRCIGTDSTLIFFYFHSGITDPFAYKRRICLYRI